MTVKLIENIEEYVDEDPCFYTFSIRKYVITEAKPYVTNFNEDFDDIKCERPIWELDIDLLYDDEKIAWVELYLILDGLIGGNIQYYIEVADDISGDALTELSALLRHKYYSRDAFVDYDSDCPLPNCSLVYSGSIHTFYIKPEFRQKNIGGFLLKNLNKILAYYEDINVRCLITYVNPYHNNKPGKYASTNDEGPSEQDKKMIKHICSFLRKNGFKKVRGKDNIYIVDLFEEAIC